jgi:hypothetical protein
MINDPNQAHEISRARALHLTQLAKAPPHLIAKKIEILRNYDALNMDSALAIFSWGRSGSFLVASYLDGHDQIVMLPGYAGLGLYKFFENNRTLSWRDKLTMYPFTYNLFEGDFAIEPTAYHAALAAVFDTYGGHEDQVLGTRKAFVQLVHVTYSVALGRLTATPRPLIVYGLHSLEDGTASLFADDFPRAQFLQPIRDPITVYDRTFEYFYTQKGDENSSWWVIRALNNGDHPFPKIEQRSRAVRFEDLHTNTEATMRRLAGWLRIPFQATLLVSTFNGTPWVVERAGNAWTGARPDQAARSSRYISFTDRALLFAMFFENFVAWNYPHPKLMRFSIVRIITCLLFVPIPWKAEIISARATIRQNCSHSWSGTARGVCYVAERIIMRRLATMFDVTSEVTRRVLFGKALFKILE